MAKNGLSMNEVTKLTFVVFSCKHSSKNNNLYYMVPEIFANIGLEKNGISYLPPRFIFWNL